MNFQESENYIHSLYRKAQPGLARITQLLALLGNPEKQLKFVHIAGTNGKGSTAAMTASVLTKAGYKTGLFTSPFIYRFNERMQIGGVQIADADVVDLVARVKEKADTMADYPTEFEFVTGMAMVYFLEQGCDLVVLEVGMGGLIDATNAIPAPEVAVITNIGLDHTDALGDTLEKIAANKAGIIKPGSIAVVYRGSAGVEQVYEETCQKLQVPLKKADFDSICLRSHDLSGQRFDWGQYRDLQLPLLGHHQLYNAAVVLGVLEALQEKGWNITEEHIRQGLQQVSWPGRFDIVGHDPLFIIDGGHNPQCIRALVENIRDYLAGRRVIALTGVLADKDYGDMFRPVMAMVEQFVCVTPNNPRKLQADLLAEHLQKAGAKAEACQSFAQGVAKARELAGKDGVVLCFGSLYTIGDIKKALES